ncbi:phenylalanyl-tRNA synthetase [Multifurca ochricompacta]|uniref:Phenylalanine--tRNA ligase, mitochondrial n=1 Tax=Multifurca ochricompacta TaxID=376703 RepID=A0AAD4MAH7_9AGAM|nr:phenylalanyl-tRNA synthetase [Multifurca ochricompacta]
MLLSRSRPLYRFTFNGWISTSPSIRKFTNTPSSIRVLEETYPTDDYTNLTPSILSKLSRRLHAQKGHPISTLRSLVESHFPDFSHLSSLSPVVTPYQNFDSLSFPADHPGRAKTDSYYINKNAMLRTHTSAHEVEIFSRGIERWLLTADVYRRDEIDASHYPVFHQMEGAKIFDTDASSIERVERECQLLERQLAASNIAIEDVQHMSETNPAQTSHDMRSSEVTAKNLKLCLNSLLYKLFAGVAGATKDDPLRVRWIEAYFPFTSPSFEVEVFFRGKWLEILGCGVVLQSTLDRAGVANKMGWAFGLGLERIAMILYSIPDIRLFWSEDARFLSQFTHGKIDAFKPYSRYPPSHRDISFWKSSSDMHDNDLYDVIRDVAGDLVEDVAIIDRFTHQKTQRHSLTVRVIYRSFDRSLVNEEVNVLQNRVVSRLRERLGVEIR